MIDFNKLLLPLTVVSAVGTVYILLRNNGPNNGATVPNPAASGVTGAYTDTGAVQPVSYNVQPTAMAASLNPVSVLSDPNSTNPASQTQSLVPPAYLVFNYGPSHDLTKNAYSSPSSSSDSDDAGGCGCSGCSSAPSCPGANSASCGDSSSFSDGASGTPAASSSARLIRNSGGDWMEKAAANINSYLAITNNAPSIPTLVSNPASGALYGANWIQ